MSVLLTHEPLSVDRVLDAVKRPSAGGIDLFVGVVRDENDAKPVVLLEYMAYESMAQREMASIVDEVAAEIPGVTLAVEHRLGNLAVGDIAVICAASAPHRGEAFTACRVLIDRIKHRVPIWKREHGPEGAYWVGWVDARCGAHA